MAGARSRHRSRGLVTVSEPEDAEILSGFVKGLIAMGLLPYTDREWQTLRLAPFWILSAVVGRDRNFDEADREAFVLCLTRARLVASDPLTMSVLEALTSGPDGLWGQYEADTRSISSGLHDTALALDKVPPEQALAFRIALVRTIGVGLATARGPYGRAATVEDLQRLRLAAMLMSFDESRSDLTAGVA